MKFTRILQTRSGIAIQPFLGSGLMIMGWIVGSIQANKAKKKYCSDYSKCNEAQKDKADHASYNVFASYFFPFFIFGLCCFATAIASIMARSRSSYSGTRNERQRLTGAPLRSYDRARTDEENVSINFVTPTTT